MRTKKIAYTALLLLLFAASSYARDGDFGETLQIYTRLRSFMGKPTWLLLIRDLDHDQTIPYMFDIRRSQNMWFALTYGRHYQIIASTLQLSTYQSEDNHYATYTINNFCHLESGKDAIQGESMYITVEGNLDDNPSGYTCHVSRYAG